jgi:hypothetical protein
LGERHGPVEGYQFNVDAVYILIAFPSRTVLEAVRQYDDAKNSGGVASL